jgi:heat shock protein HslJ
MEPLGHRGVQASMTLRYVMTAAATIAVLTGCSQANGGSPAEPADAAGPSQYQDIRWEPLPKYTGGKETKAHLIFLDDGTWTGSDGCNGQSGDYTIAADGHLTADPNPQTLIGCPGVSINSALGSSDRIAVKDDHLTLYDGQRVVLEFVEAGQLK